MYDIQEQSRLIEPGLMSHQTHYRSYRGRVFTGQMTQPTVLNTPRTTTVEIKQS